MKSILILSEGNTPGTQGLPSRSYLLSSHHLSTTTLRTRLPSRGGPNHIQPIQDPSKVLLTSVSPIPEDLGECPGGRPRDGVIYNRL